MCDLLRHNQTQKHIINNKKNHTKRDKQDKKMECEECNKTFQTRSGLWRHRKKCAGNNIENSNVVENPDNTDYKSMFLDAMSQNKVITDLLKEQSKVNIEQSKIIKELILKNQNL
jgi:hypothetical protein